jgi:hypothetical protein
MYVNSLLLKDIKHAKKYKQKLKVFTPKQGRIVTCG